MWSALSASGSGVLLKSPLLAKNRPPTVTVPHRAPNCTCVTAIVFTSRTHNICSMVTLLSPDSMRCSPDSACRFVLLITLIPESAMIFALGVRLLHPSNIRKSARTHPTGRWALVMRAEPEAGGGIVEVRQGVIPLALSPNHDNKRRERE